MALKKLSKSYGTSYAGLTASLRDMSGQPARYYTSASMTSVIPDGKITLNAQGGFTLWVDDSKVYQLAIFGWDVGSVMLTDLNLEVDSAVQTGLTAAQVAGGAVSILGLSALGDPVMPDGRPGPTLRFKASGTTATPLSTFVGANAFGALGKPQDIKIPAGYLIPGQSLIRVVLRLRKTGSDAASYLQLHLGTSNGTADPNLLSGMGATQFSSLNPYDAFWYFDLSVSTGGILISAIRAASNVGLGNVTGEFTGQFNPAVDNFLNFVVSGATTGNSYLLLGYYVDVLQ